METKFKYLIGIGLANFIVLTILVFGQTPVKNFLDKRETKAKLQATIDACDQVRDFQIALRNFLQSNYSSGCHAGALLQQAYYLAGNDGNNIDSVNHLLSKLEENFEKDEQNEDKIINPCADFESSFSKNHRLDLITINMLENNIGCDKARIEMESVSN